MSKDKKPIKINTTIAALLEICNFKWRQSKHYYNLTPHEGRVKFVPATHVEKVTSYDDHYMVLLNAGIWGMPQFKVMKAEVDEWEQRQPEANGCANTGTADTTESE